MIRNWKERTDRLRNVMEEAVASGEECGCQLVVYEDGERVCRIYRAGPPDPDQKRCAVPDFLRGKRGDGDGVSSSGGAGKGCIRHPDRRSLARIRLQRQGRDACLAYSDPSGSAV